MALERRDGLTNILFNLGLPSFDALTTNAAMSYSRVWNSCTRSPHLGKEFMDRVKILSSHNLLFGYLHLSVGKLRLQLLLTPAYVTHTAKLRRNHF